jgi:hypothetical protein
MSSYSNSKNGKIVSRNAGDSSGVLCPRKVANARPDEKMSITKGVNEQRETHLHLIRRRCRHCAITSREITFCTSWDCPLHPYRFGVLPKTFGNHPASEFSPNPEKAGGERHWKPDWSLIRAQPKYTPMEAIRLHCLWCNGSPKGVAGCCNGKCPLHLLRFGKDPRRKKRHLTVEEKVKFLNQMKGGKK